MNKDNQRLIIAIPTYNRPRAIEKQVRTILAQINNNNKIGLFVFDNASLIPVETLFSSEEKKRFNIFRNSTNIGPEANIALCFKECLKADWGYILGDDDPLTNDSINKILETIKQYPDVDFINFECRETKKIPSYRELLSLLGESQESFGNMLWLSKGVYHMSRYKESFIPLFTYTYTGMNQIYFLLDHFKRYPDSELIQTNTVLLENPELGGWSPYQFTLKLFPIYNYWRKEEYNKEIRSFIGNIARIQLANLWTSIYKRNENISPQDVYWALKQIIFYNKPRDIINYNKKRLLLILIYILFPRISQKIKKRFING